MLIVMTDPANMFLCLKSENFWKFWLTRAESGFLKIGRRVLAFHIFKNLRLFDKKIVAGLEKCVFSNLTTHTCISSRRSGAFEFSPRGVFHVVSVQFNFLH